MLFETLRVVVSLNRLHHILVCNIQAYKYTADLKSCRWLREIWLKVAEEGYSRMDYGCDVGDLFIRFIHVDYTEGEPTGDGRVIVHYDKKGRVAAIEIISDL